MAPVIDQIVYSYLKKMDQVKDAVVKDETPKTVWQTTKLVYGIKEIPEDERILS